MAARLAAAEDDQVAGAARSVEPTACWAAEGARREAEEGPAVVAGLRAAAASLLEGVVDNCPAVVAMRQVVAAGELAAAASPTASDQKATVDGPRCCQQRQRCHRRCEGQELAARLPSDLKASHC